MMYQETTAGECKFFNYLAKNSNRRFHIHDDQLFKRFKAKKFHLLRMKWVGTVICGYGYSSK